MGQTCLSEIQANMQNPQDGNPIALTPRQPRRPIGRQAAVDLEEEEQVDGDVDGPLSMQKEEPVDAAAATEDGPSTSGVGPKPKAVPDVIIDSQPASGERPDVNGNINAEGNVNPEIESNNGEFDQNQLSEEEDVPCSKPFKIFELDDTTEMRFPRAYRWWTRFVALILLAQGILMIVSPQKASNLGFLGTGYAENGAPTQCYGGCSIGLAALIGLASDKRHKQLANLKLLSIMMYFWILCSVDIGHAYKDGLDYISSVKGFTQNTTRMIIIFICGFFWICLVWPSSGPRKPTTTTTTEDQA